MKSLEAIFPNSHEPTVSNFGSISNRMQRTNGARPKGGFDFQPVLLGTAVYYGPTEHSDNQLKGADMFSKQRAEELIGKSRSEYQCNHVVNYVLNGNKNIGGLANDYLNYGQSAQTPAEGVVVVGKDGAHVGIFISSTEFIHSSSSKYQVIKANLSQLVFVFPKGYVLRR